MIGTGHRRPRLLVLTPRYPYPVIGGDRLRIHRVCRELAKRYSLTLLSLCETAEELSAPSPLDGVFSRIERVLLPRWRSYVNVLAALPGRTPLQVAYYRSAGFAAAVRRLLPEHDACLAHLIRTGEYVRGAAIPAALEMTDAISMNYQRVKALGAGRSWRKRVYALEASRLADYERRVLSDFDVVALVSETDRDFLLAGREAPHVIVASNGTDVGGVLPAAPAREPVAAFVGNITSVQNIDACVFFAEEVLPRLRKLRGWRFRVVGNIGQADAERLRRFEGVDVTGRVDSIATGVQGSLVGVCPVRLAAGVQNKLLEYMALGLPAVTTRIGLEGLEAKPGKEVLVADAPEEFVEQLERLHADRGEASKLALAGLAYVRQRHSWEERLQPMVAAIDSLVARRRPDRRLTALRETA